MKTRKEIADELEEESIVKTELVSVGLEISSAIFAIIGIVTAVKINIASGVPIIFASLILWGIACSRREIIEALRSDSNMRDKEN